MNESQYGVFREAPVESSAFTSKDDDDWTHGVHKVLTLLDYVPISNDTSLHHSKERFFNCRLSFRDLACTDIRQRQSSLSSDGNSESEYNEAPEKELFKRDFVSDDYDSAFSGLLHLPSFSFSGGKLGAENINSRKWFYCSNCKIGELSYLFGGLVIDVEKGLKSLGIPRSTDLSNISVHCSTVLPPYMDKALITSPMFVPNKKIHTSNPARSTIIHVNHDIYESRSPFDICAMTGTQISESQIFFCGGFKVITDKVDFDSRTNRWKVYKSIELNRNGFILDVKTFSFSNIKISSNSDFAYDGKIGFSMCSSMVDAFETGKRVFSNPDSNSELSSPEVPISSPGPIYPSCRYDSAASSSTSPSQSNSVSTTPVSAKSPISTKSVGSMKSPASRSNPNSNQSTASDRVQESDSKQTSPIREKLTSAASNSTERGTLSSHSSLSRDSASREKEAKLSVSSKTSSSTRLPSSSSSQREKSSLQMPSRTPSSESANASALSHATRGQKLKDDKFARSKIAEKKATDESDSKGGHKFMLAIPGRLFHRSGKHSTPSTPLPSPSIATSKTIRSKASHDVKESKSGKITEIKEALGRKEYVEKSDRKSTHHDLEKRRVVSESESTLTSVPRQVSVSPEILPNPGLSNSSSTTAQNFQLDKLDTACVESTSKSDASSKSVSQPSSAKDARSGSKGSDEMFLSRTAGSDGSVHRHSSVESKNSSEEKPVIKIKTNVKRAQTFESIEETLSDESGENNKTQTSPENTKSSILTVCVYIFGGFNAKHNAEGKQTFVATNELLKLELLVSEPSTLQFHPEAIVISTDQNDVVPSRRGFFASVIVSAESARNLLKASQSETASKSSETIAGLKSQSKTNIDNKSRDQFHAEHSFDDKCLLVHGGVDERHTTFGDSFLYHFQSNTWIEFKTFSYDYYNIPKQPYEDEDIDRLRLDSQVEDPEVGEAELRACHHQAHVMSEGDTEYLIFVGGYYNDYLRHYDPEPYKSDKIDISRLIRLSFYMKNSNLLRMPFLNLSTQTWYLKRYFYEFTHYVTPQCANMLDNEYLVNANVYVTGGEISVVRKQIVICQGQLQLTPPKFADFNSLREAAGTPHILSGGHVLITFPGI